MLLDDAADILPENGLAAGRERFCEETKIPGIAICADKRCPIQKRILATVLKVPKPRRSRLRNERSSRGYLRKPLGGAVISAQVNLSWVLLANNAEGRTSLRQGLRQVSKVLQSHQTTVRRIDTHDGPLAIHSMGSRYHGPLPDRT